MSEVKSNRAWRLECETLQQDVVRLLAERTHMRTELLQDIERLTAELAESKKQIGSYKTLTHALEAQVSNYRNVSGRYQESIKTMQSERDANAILTDELTETRDLTEHWAILTEQRRMKLEECRKNAEKVSDLLRDWKTGMIDASDLTLALFQIYPSTPAMKAKP